VELPTQSREQIFKTKFSGDTILQGPNFRFSYRFVHGSVYALPVRTVMCVRYKMFPSCSKV